MPRVYTRTPLAERFWKYVSPCPNTGCWLWEGACQPEGYGLISAGGRGSGLLTASHVSLELHGRPKPSEGMLACHHCDMPACVNPDHLYWGTQSDNNRDGYKRGRMVSPSKRGEASSRARLTDGAALEIRDSSATFQELSDKYGVSLGAVSNVAYGKSWQHITGGDRRTPTERLTARYVRETCFADWVSE